MEVSCQFRFQTACSRIKEAPPRFSLYRRLDGSRNLHVNALGKRKLFSPRRVSNPDFPVIQPGRSLCTETLASYRAIWWLYSAVQYISVQVWYGIV